MGTADLICRQNPELPANVGSGRKNFPGPRSACWRWSTKCWKYRTLKPAISSWNCRPSISGNLLEQVGEGFANQMLNKEQKLDLKIDPGCLVSGDLEWLKVIFDNLISNAVKFSPAGASITVAVRCLEKTVLVDHPGSWPGAYSRGQEKTVRKIPALERPAYRRRIFDGTGPVHCRADGAPTPGAHLGRERNRPGQHLQR